MKNGIHALASKPAEKFYKQVIQDLGESGVPFMLGGAYALRTYTGIHRNTKDIDVFCKPSDYDKILGVLKNKGYETEVTDKRWIVKAFYKDFFIDIIFNSNNEISPVDDLWFTFATTTTLFDYPVKVMPAEEMIWSKAFIQTRDRFDGADIAHIILKRGHLLDWERLVERFTPHFEVLLMQLISFQYVYPSEKNIVPSQVIKDLLHKMQKQVDEKPISKKLCRGRMLSFTEYEIDFKEWGFKDER